MKRCIPALLIFVSLIIVLAACGDKDTERQPGDPAKALFITVPDASQRFALSEFKRLNDDFDIDVEMFSANNTPAEIDGIERAVADGYDVIFINSSNVTAVIPALTAAKEAGVIIGLFSAGLPEGQPGEDFIDFFCGPDYFLSGMMAGEYISSLFIAGANVAEIGGPEGNAMQTQLQNGFYAGLADNIDLLDSQNCTGWSVEHAYRIMEDFMARFGADLNIVWCHWDDGANSVIEAALAAGRSDIMVVGVGGTGVGFRNVRDGLQAMTVGINYSNIVRRSMQNARTLLDGGAVPMVNIIPMDLITGDTIDNFHFPDW